jgi:hypothetical protein
MNMRDYFDWRLDLLRIVCAELAKRRRENAPCPEDDEELFEETLRAIYPPDWADGMPRKREEAQ